MFNQFGSVICENCKASMRLVGVYAYEDKDLIRWQCSQCDHERALVCQRSHLIDRGPERAST